MGCDLRKFQPAERGIQLLSRPSFVESDYEYLLLLPFCGDCQGFSPHLGACTKSRQANKLFAMEQNKIILYKKKSNTG
jgi:hypothetical protein